MAKEVGTFFLRRVIKKGVALNLVGTFVDYIIFKVSTCLRVDEV